jgi:hypothetical protein
LNLDFPVIGIVAILTGLLLQFLLKPLLELWIKPEAPNHDTVVRAVALLLGVLLTFLDILVGHPLPPDGNAWLLLIGSGAMSGLASIGGYHALTGSANPTVTSSVVTGEMPTGAANSALNLPTVATFSPSPTHQAAGIAGTFTSPPAANANAKDNVPIPQTLTEAVNNGRQGMPASMIPESERTSTLPPAVAPPSPAPEPVASAAPPAQP